MMNNSFPMFLAMSMGLASMVWSQQMLPLSLQFIQNANEWKNIQVQTSVPAETDNLAICPKGIQIAMLDQQHLGIRIVGLKKEEPLKKAHYHSRKTSVLIRMSSESTDEKVWSFPLTEDILQNGEWLGKLPIDELGQSPWLMNLSVQTLLYVKEGMVGREASVYYPAKAPAFLLHADFLTQQRKTPQIVEASCSSGAGACTVLWQSDLKCRGSVVLKNDAGEIVRKQDRNGYYRYGTIHFRDLPSGSYSAELQLESLTGTQKRCQLDTIKITDESSALQDAWLQVKGKYVVDSANRPFRMVGMARCQYHETDEYRDFGPLNFQLDHYRNLGINCIRLAFCPNRLESPTANFYEIGCEAFIEKYIAPDVQAIIDAGLYVILDSHHIDSTLEAAYARIPLWEALAKRYANEPKVAAYELWNESYVQPTGLTPESAPGLRQWYKDCIAAIRKHDQRHIIMVSDWNAGWGDALKTMWIAEQFHPDVTGKQIIFSRHMAKDHCTNDFVSRALDEIADQWNIPLVIGELELEAELMSDPALTRLLDNLLNNPNQYGVWLWRPHADSVIHTDVWSPWAKNYASKVPFSPKKGRPRLQPASLPPLKIDRFPPEMEQTANGAFFNAKVPAYGYASHKLEQSFPPGQYRFMFTVKAPAEGGNAIGIYRNTAKGHVQLGIVNLPTGQEKNVSFTFFTDEPFSEIIYKKMSDKQEKTIFLQQLTMVPLSQIVK